MILSAFVHDNARFVPRLAGSDVRNTVLYNTLFYTIQCNTHHHITVDTYTARHYTAPLHTPHSFNARPVELYNTL